MLSYVQGESADIWKDNILENLEEGILEYKSVGEFLAGIKKEFGEGEEESVKVVESKKLKQGEKMIEEFVQEFKRAVKEYGYEERPLVEKFKRRMNRAIRRKLMEAEWPPTDH